MTRKSTAISAPNIALLKYWGKKDDLLKIALNDSISITLDENVLRSKTTIEILDSFGADEIGLNGKKVNDEKINEWLMLVRKRLLKKYPVLKNKIKIESENNFPTSTGIASSASGFCALATALCACLGIEKREEMSRIARLGSGSASRSVYGGFVQWKAGTNTENSFAVQIKPKEHWDDIYDVIAVVDEGIKKVSSKDGMENTVRSSRLMHCRLAEIKKRRVRMLRAIGKRDFDSLAIEMMRDSNQMHATMLDSWPPIFYMNDVSREIVYSVHETNLNGIVAGYTFDAGPNAHVICQKKNLEKVKGMLLGIKGVSRLIVSGVGNGSKVVK